MTLHELERKRRHFLEKFQVMAKSINYQLFENMYHIEVFFSGRDEDFIVISFKSNIKLVELSIELTNHHYDLVGNESVYYRFFKIDNGQFNEVLKGRFTFPENDTKEFKLPINLILEKLKQGLQEAFL